MPLVREVRRFAVLAAFFALAAVLTGPVGAVAQDTIPQCSDGVDNDGDRAIDGADSGCGAGSDDDETDSPYAGIEIVTVALPLVSLSGQVDARGNVDVKKLLIRARRGSNIEVTCQGGKCPFVARRRQMLTNSIRLTFLERRLKAPITLTLKIQRRGNLGKFVRYRLRRKNTPVRVDDCLDQDTGVRTSCYPD